jgi:hypothetical protein
MAQWDEFCRLEVQDLGASRIVDFYVCSPGFTGGFSPTVFSHGHSPMYILFV